MVKIGTHNGCFHADEVLAIVLLRQLAEFKDAEIVRSRDMKVIETCDIVVDVGAKFEPENKRFDHHQREFTETMRSLKVLNFDTKLSSAGLIYAFYGKAVINALTGKAINSPENETIYKKLYESFVEEFDGVDNGVNQYEGEAKYKISSTIGARVGRLNPSWNAPDKSPEAEMKGFEKALDMVEEEFKDRINWMTGSWMPARSIVQAAIDERKESELIIFGSGGLPWKEHLFQIEKELKIEGHIKYAVYKNKETDWRIQCVPVSVDSFTNRKSLPENWRGVRDEKLAEVCGVADATFCHTSGFIGGARSEEGVMKMAKMALEN